MTSSGCSPGNGVLWPNAAAVVVGDDLTWTVHEPEPAEAQGPSQPANRPVLPGVGTSVKLEANGTSDMQV